MALRAEIDPRRRALGADRTRMRQILTNFPSNALKFTEAGEVTLVAQPLQARDAHLVKHLAVCDAVRGIEPSG